MCTFIFGKSSTILLSDINSEKGHACVRAESNWEISVSSCICNRYRSLCICQFCYEHTIAVKKVTVQYSRTLLVWYRELCSMLCNNLNGKEFENVYIPENKS